MTKYNYTENEQNPLASEKYVLVDGGGFAFAHSSDDVSPWGSTLSFKRVIPSPSPADGLVNFTVSWLVWSMYYAEFALLSPVDDIKGYSLLPNSCRTH